MKFALTLMIGPRWGCMGTNQDRLFVKVLSLKINLLADMVGSGQSLSLVVLVS